MLPSVHLKLHDARQLIANALFLRLATGMLLEMQIRSSGVSEPSSLYFTRGPRYVRYKSRHRTQS
jgi:hypothetical protein